MANKTDEKRRTVTVKIEGRVQGVYFRAWTYETAQSLGLDGTVRNMSDGSVEAVFSGPTHTVDEDAQALRRWSLRCARDQGHDHARGRLGRARLQGDRDGSLALTVSRPNAC